MPKPFVCGLFGPHPHAHSTKFVICGACSCPPTPAHLKRKSKKIYIFFTFFSLKIKFFYKKVECSDVRRTSAPRRAHGRTGMHFFENFCAPLCTKIAAPAGVGMHAHARTLKVFNPCPQMIICLLIFFISLM